MRNQLTRALLLQVMVVVALGNARCASSSSDQAPSSLEVHITQLPDSGFAVENRGATSVAYEMLVRNHSTGAVTLRSVEMRTVGRSPYSLRSEPAALSQTIEAGKETTVTFSMWSYAQQKGSTSENTVWVNGTVHYTGTSGEASQPFAQSFRAP